MADIANFVAQNFRPVSYGNVLAQAQSLNDAKQANQMRQYQLERSQAADNALAGGDVNAMARVDPGMAGQYQGVMNAQQQTATETLARMMEAVGKSGNPKLLGAQVTQMPAFQEALKALQLDPAQFTVDDTDTDDTLRQQAMDLAQLFGGIPSMLENQAIPSDVRSAQWYASQSPEMQEIYQNTKRAPAVAEIAGGMVQTNAPGGPRRLSTLDEEANAAQVLASATQTGKETATTEAIPERSRVQSVADDFAAAPQRLEAARDLSFQVEQLDPVFDRVLDNAGAWTVGFGSIAKAPGSPAANMAADLETLGANAAFDRLQQMRESSPTGGALGAISERELSLLQSAVAAIAQSQSPAQFKSNVERLRDNYKRIGDLSQVAVKIDGLKTRINAMQARQQTPETQAQLEELTRRLYAEEDSLWDQLDTTAGVSPQRKRVKVDAEGNVIGN